MEMVIQQYEKAKVIQDEQLERLTHICQEQGVSKTQLYFQASVKGFRSWILALLKTNQAGKQAYLFLLINQSPWNNYIQSDQITVSSERKKNISVTLTD